MKKFATILFIISLIILTSIIKTSTREVETKIFNSEEKIKILYNKKELIQLQNSYLSSPERLFYLKNNFLQEELTNLKFKQFKYLNHNEK